MGEHIQQQFEQTQDFIGMAIALPRPNSGTIISSVEDQAVHFALDMERDLGCSRRPGVPRAYVLDAAR